MKIGILQTAPNNCAFLDSLCRKSGVQLVNFVDEAVLEAAVRAGKNIAVETICVESAKNCLAETGSEALADEYFIRYLRENRDRYSAFVIPQVPLSRIMVKIRDLKTPVFDSMEPFVDKLINGACSGFEAGLIKK